MTEPDDALLAAYADRLWEAVRCSLEPWLRAQVARRLGDTELSAGQRAELERTVSRASADAVEQLGRLLRTDIDAQRSTPLSVLRAAAARPGAVLAAAGVPAPERDEFEQRSLPDDTYDLAPRTFADLGQEVGEAGLAWGAAKAHVHLRRHRDPRS